MALEARAEVLWELGGSRCEGASGGDQILFPEQRFHHASTLG